MVLPTYEHECAAALQCSWVYEVASGSVYTFLKGESIDLNNSTFALNDI